MGQLQSIFNLTEICAQHGIEHAILSPGSRCAPITLAFTRHPKITTKTISDERSAAFIALGMAQYTKKPVVLVCTSGSAAYNYAPAIAEAYYQQIPLLVLTADRPPEWIDQYDGQTIRQENIYGNHVKASFTLPVDITHNDAQWHFYRTINEAINKTSQPFGPVHINIPLREPFYPEEGKKIQFTNDIPVFKEELGIPSLLPSQLEKLKKDWSQFHNKLIVIGQTDSIDFPINDLTEKYKIPVLGDIISNAHGNKTVIRHQDLFLGGHNGKVHQSLQPDLLITFGKSLISKNLKLFLRKYKPKAHWHIQPFGKVADTFQSLTNIIRTTPKTFFNTIVDEKDHSLMLQKQGFFYKTWNIEEQKAIQQVNEFSTNEPLNELEAYQIVMKILPSECSLHLANSMAVRYANFIGLQPQQAKVKVFANRGTSGIDGSNSTAVGSTLISDKTTVLLTGDMAFFYDRNSFWHNYDLPNLKIIVFNNHGGGIFNMIKGPSDQSEYKEYFETDQKLSAKSVAQEHGFEYISCNSTKKLNIALKDLFESKITTILEIETTSEINKKVLQMFKEYFEILDTKTIEQND
ncbi:MAG: 2-succinyl-5-enolpyruvyl-6-hydroxy-3-cyclohexene-1-carboxylic-acid synthase [Cyclobacteriaceae bacterium]|nr:2-succinyl-5-enolpyruvyl-6-hydroxy-3-cyclohexene-1-carboxylic-acid synthase [Cyclobacteriaceae bacterium]